jgi:hypothetical protein
LRGAHVQALVANAPPKVVRRGVAGRRDEATPASGGRKTRTSVERVVSGGQTGADQGGLEAAARLGVRTGSYMPKGWRTEDGPRPDLAARFGLVEATTAEYPDRTERNVPLADATVVFAAGVSPGSRRRCDYATSTASPAWRRRRARRPTTERRGCQESGAPGIGAHVARVIERALAPGLLHLPRPGHGAAAVAGVELVHRSHEGGRPPSRRI